MRTPDGKIIGGVALEVGKFIAEKLGVPFELVPYADANAYTQSFGKGEWDIGIGAPTPLVAEKADFIVDVVLTDYMFLAAPGTRVCRRRSSRPARSQDRGWAEHLIRPVPQPHAEIR